MRRCVRNTTHYFGGFWSGFDREMQCGDRLRNGLLCTKAACEQMSVTSAINRLAFVRRFISFGIDSRNFWWSALRRVVRARVCAACIYALCVCVNKIGCAVAATQPRVSTEPIVYRLFFPERNLMLTARWALAHATCAADLMGKTCCWSQCAHRAAGTRTWIGVHVHSLRSSV